MSITTLIVGETGCGKSTSIRNLDPKDTFIINVLDKPLPFRGWKTKFKKLEPDGLTGNYFSSTNAQKIIRVINFVNEKRPEIKHLIIDDWQYVLSTELMNKAFEKGFEKFLSIAHAGWSIINAIVECREDLYGFVLTHSDTDINGKSKCKTIGKMLDEKICVEGMFTVVLHSLVNDGEYVFLTQNDGTHIAKSPLDMFEDKYITNDLAEIIKAYEEFN